MPARLRPNAASLRHIDCRQASAVHLQSTDDTAAAVAAAALRIAVQAVESSRSSKANAAVRVLERLRACVQGANTGYLCRVLRSVALSCGIPARGNVRAAGLQRQTGLHSLQASERRPPLCTPPSLSGPVSGTTRRHAWLGVQTRSTSALTTLSACVYSCARMLPRSMGTSFVLVERPLQLVCYSLITRAHV